MNTVKRDLALLEQIWDRSLSIDLIAEEFAYRSAEESAAEVRQLMEARNWDVIGVRRGGADGQARSAYVLREELVEGTCEDFLRQFAVEDLVSGQTPIRQCLRRLVKKGFLFVLGPSGVDSIVALADLQKQPVRLMLFAVVSLLEMALGVRLREAFPEERWRALLSKERVEGAERLHAERRKKDQDIDLADCLQLCDKATVFLKSEGVSQQWGFRSKQEARGFFESLQTLRDNLAHAHDPTNGKSWDEVCQTFLRAEELIRRLTETDAGLSEAVHAD